MRKKEEKTGNKLNFRIVFCVGYVRCSFEVKIATKHGLLPKMIDMQNLRCAKKKIISFNHEYEY